MADPTLRLTFSQLRIRVAEFLGIADTSGGAAALPSDAHDLDLVGRVVNDGYRRFISENEKWSFLNVPLTLRFVAQTEYTLTGKSATTVTVGAIAGTYADDYFNGYQLTLVDEDTGTNYPVTVTDYTGATGIFTFTAVDSNIESGDTMKIAGLYNTAGEAWRYLLPDDFYGILKAPFTYDENGPRVRIAETSELEVREARAGARSTGTPSFVAFRPINTTAATTATRWEALFWPEPSGNEIISGVYKRFPQALSANGDVSVAGFQHDQTVLAAALAAAELYRNDTIGVNEASYQQALARSLKLDARATPARNRPFGDRSDAASYGRPSSYAEPTSYNGTSLD